MQPFVRNKTSRIDIFMKVIFGSSWLLLKHCHLGEHWWFAWVTKGSLGWELTVIFMKEQNGFMPVFLRIGFADCNALDIKFKGYMTWRFLKSLSWKYQDVLKFTRILQKAAKCIRRQNWILGLGNFWKQFLGDISADNVWHIKIGWAKF